MSVIPVADLVDAVRRARLLPLDQLDELASLQGRFSDTRMLAGELLRRNWLTAYQVNQLCAGRGADLVLGSYVLLDKLGEGGMGAVFRARNWKLGQIVALKLIKKERLGNEAVVRRFQREIRAAAQLDHTHLVRAFDADAVGGTHFLVMEYVEGTDLARLVRERGPLPVGQACEYVRQGALGLQHAFEKGMVHRDIKPANLLLTPRGVVKVLDLGLALPIATDEGGMTSTLTGEGTVLGTPDYMAPEQTLDAHTVDIRADLYSLGCTLYHLLTGRLPFPGGTLGEKIARHLAREPEPVERLRPDVPPGVAAMVRKLMAKKPEERFQTPADLAKSLDGAATVHTPEVLASATRSGDTVAMTPDTFAFSATTAVRRTVSPHGWRRVAVAVVVAILIVGLGVVVWSNALRTQKDAETRDPGEDERTVRPAELPEKFKNTIGMQMVLIKAGTFRMGSPSEDKGAQPNEMAQHPVKITRDFYMGATEVTREQFEQFIKAEGYKTDAEKGGDTSTWRKNDSSTKDNQPVVFVSWNDAVAFCKWLSKKESKHYDLPTEAEWEYACRAGGEGAYCFGNDSKQLGDYAWFVDNSGGKTHAVGTKKANAWGLFDMHGNAWEWCKDWYGDHPAKEEAEQLKSPIEDPEGPENGTSRVLRGGSWINDHRSVRSASRGGGGAPGLRDSHIGFRVVLRPGVKVAPAEPSGRLTNSIGMQMVRIKAGTFRMGSPPEDKDAQPIEMSQHPVKITHDFYMGATEVTAGQFKQFVQEEGYKTDAEKAGSTITWKKNDFSTADDQPVVYVSWNDAMAFCQWLSKKESKTYDLPTEAEWEYACRAGGKPGDLYGFGNDRDKLGDHAWFQGNAGGKTHPVGTKRANAWGLFDVHGNVWELCKDSRRTYPTKEEAEQLKSPIEDPEGPESGKGRVLRGGSYDYDSRNCRSAVRYDCAPGFNSYNVGFRVVLLPGVRVPPVDPSEKFASTIGMQMVRIKAGTFRMGSPPEDKDKVGGEVAQHPVKITRDFYMGATEVTVGQFKQFVREDGYKTEAEKDRNQETWQKNNVSTEDNQPVVLVTWNDAVAFCKWLSKKEGKLYDLPTEAEWEYACRAGGKPGDLYCFGNDRDKLGDYAWFQGNAGGRTHPVGTKQANAWGLFDMHGNVWEWCKDSLRKYPTSDEVEKLKEPIEDPESHEDGQPGVLRGGSWNHDPRYCRSAGRNSVSPVGRTGDIGFRVVLRPGVKVP